MTYSFRNRFQVKDKSPLGIDATECRLTPAESNEHVVLKAGIRNTNIRDCDNLALEGSGYADSDAALSAGRKWRQILISWLARLRIGSEIGGADESKIVPDEFAQSDLTERFGVRANERLFLDQIGLLVFETEPRAHFAHLQMFAPNISYFNSDTLGLVAAADERYIGEWSDELVLAYKLVHASLSDTNPESKFILLVTAIEALIPYQKKEDELSKMLEALRPVAAGMSQFDRQTRNTVDGLLKSNQKNSVRQYGLKLAGRLSGEYDEMSPVDYYDEVYGTRSALAHGNLRNIPKLSEDALGQQYAELLRFVLDILESWTANPTFDAPDQTGDASNSTGDGTAES